MQLVHDLGSVFERVVQPAVSDEAECLLDGVLMFVHYYETNENFDLLTHGMEPGIVAVVMHNFSQFMGDLMGQKLDHCTQYKGKRLYLQMYMEKLRDIVNSIVVDRADEYTGKMLKKQEDKAAVPVAQTKKKVSVKKSTADSGLKDREVEVLSDGSCSTDRKDFSTLTNISGRAYHPPSHKISKSHYARKVDPADDLIHRIEDLKKTLDKQKKQISHLTAENNEAKDEIKRIRTRNEGEPQAEKKLKKSKNLQDVVSVDRESSDDPLEAKPDSTQLKEVTAGGSDTGSVFQSAQLCKK